jgi:hypothetical protein
MAGGPGARPFMATPMGVYARPPAVPRPFKAGTVRTHCSNTISPTAHPTASGSLHGDVGSRLWTLAPRDGRLGGGAGKARARPFQRGFNHPLMALLRRASDHTFSWRSENAASSTISSAKPMRKSRSPTISLTPNPFSITSCKAKLA